MNRYCCMYDGWQVFIWALNWWEAQDSAAEVFKPTKLSDIVVRPAP